MNIIGGPAQDGEWPWQIALMWNNIYVCSAALLTPDWAVTTAQCVNQEASGYSILIGTNNLAEWSPNYQRQPVASVYKHPEYNTRIHDFDVALLRLTDPVEITDYSRTICIPTTDMSFEVGTTCYASGWGSSDGINEFLQEAQFSITSSNNCEGVTSNMLCADGIESSGACAGDEGGPLVSLVDTRWYLVGLTSKTTCGSGADVFTRMTAMYEWIAPILDGETPLSK
ncbi:serine protease 27-like [Amphiura filiformis]|uniref:serine protease 27-like n=1 Tax=Amphiura filiformis TaxID=82378 RepID=UPI003B218CA6